MEHWEAELGADGGFEAGMNDSHWERSMNDAHWEQGAGVGLDKTQIFADEATARGRKGVKRGGQEAGREEYHHVVP